MAYEGDEEEQRKSLLDVICERLLREKPVTSRVFLVGRRREDPLRPFFDECIAATAAYGEAAASSFTGILVESTTTFVALVEAEPKHLLRLLQTIHQKATALTLATATATATVTATGTAGVPAERIGEVRVAGYTDDIPDKAYARWVAMEFTNPGVRPTPTNTNNNTNPAAAEEGQLVMLVNDLMGLLFDLGAQLASKERLQIETYLAAVKSSRPELLPSVAQMEALLESDYPLTLEEFLSVYHTPVGIKLQAETVWPIPPPLKY